MTRPGIVALAGLALCAGAAAAAPATRDQLPFNVDLPPGVMIEKTGFHSLLFQPQRRHPRGRLCRKFSPVRRYEQHSTSPAGRGMQEPPGVPAQRAVARRQSGRVSVPARLGFRGQRATATCPRRSHQHPRARQERGCTPGRSVSLPALGRRWQRALPIGTMLSRAGKYGSKNRGLPRPRSEA
jgi:hypothetical protein